MDIPGLDSWLTTPPEEPDVLEEADKFLERMKDKQPENEDEAFVLYLIEGLREFIKDETGL